MFATRGRWLGFVSDRKVPAAASNKPEPKAENRPAIVIAVYGSRNVAPITTTAAPARAATA
jgi:hypothetical protein